MSKRRIDVYNREQACKLTPRPEVSVISISAPGKPAPLADGWCEVLRLEFHDIDPIHGEAPDMVSFNGLHVEEIFDFADRNRERDLMIHCDAGVSRSVAVGLFISNEWGGELHTHTFGKRVYTGAANGHVLRMLNRRVWLSHFAEGDKCE